MSTGSSNFGTVFKLTPSGSGYKESVLYSFSGLSDGAYPRAGLLWLNGELYGTTEEGGIRVSMAASMLAAAWSSS